MTAKRKITDKNGVQVYPITHTRAVLDDNGNSVEQRLQENLDLINQKQLELGAVPSDITPTAGSTNWVTSGGVYDAIGAIKDTLYDDTDITFYGTGKKYIDNAQGVGNECPMTYTTAAWMICWKISAKRGEYYTISGKDDRGLVWATVNGDGIITACSPEGLGTFSDLIVNIEEDCTLIVNLHNEYTPSLIKSVPIIGDIDVLKKDVHGKFDNGKEIGIRTGQRLSTDGSIVNDSWHSTYTIDNDNYVNVECATVAWLAGEPQMAAINFYSSTPSENTLIKSIRCDSNTLKTFSSPVPDNTSVICFDIRRIASNGNDVADSYIKVYKSFGTDNAYGIDYTHEKLKDVNNVGMALNYLSNNSFLKKDYGLEIASTANWSKGFLYSTSKKIVSENNDNANWKKTDYIDVESYNSMRISLPYVGSSSTNNCIAFFDSDYNVIFTYKFSVVGTTGETYVRTINIKGVSYLRLTAAVAADMSAFVFTDDVANDGYNRVTVAASDGYGRYGIADYICTGTNDELTIQQAVMDVFVHGSGEVILLPGYYYIDGFSHYNETDDIYSAIQIPNMHSVYRPTVHIRGASRTDCKLIVRGTELNGAKNYSIFACEYPRSSVTFKLSSFYIEFRTNQYKITAIDLLNCNLAEIREIVITSTASTYPAEGLIGVRGFRTAQNGNLQNISNIVCHRLYTAFDISGEHIVMSMCGALRCVYGFKFSQRQQIGESGVSDHPITLINCHDERNQNLPYFGPIAMRKQTVTFIDFNTEAEHGDTPWKCYRNYAKEAIPGTWRGVIYYCHASRQGVNVVDIPFWEHNNGLGFRTVNLAQVQRGTTVERESYTPDYCQRFFDTTLNKELICVETKGRAIGSFTVISESVSEGSITFTVGDMTNTVSIPATSGAENIAKVIFSAFASTTTACDIEGSTLLIKSSSFMVIDNSGVSYVDNGTGITFGISVRDYGSTGQWVDMMGNVV